MPRVAVCIPTYCEASNIAEVIARTHRSAPTYDIVVIDDDSPDGTARLAEAAASRAGASVEVLGGTPRSGLGAAYRRGFAHALAAGYEVVCEMDADLSHDPAELPSLVAHVQDGASLAIGSRYVRGGGVPEWAWYRRVLSEYGNRYAGFVLRLPVRDLTAGFRAYSADALRAIDVSTTSASGYAFQIECTHRAHRIGLTIVEHPIVFADRTRGTSKLSFRVALEELSLVTAWGLRDRFDALARRKPR